MKKWISLLLVFTLSHNPVFAKNKKAKESANGSNYNIRELALPSEVENVGKSAGSIYYSPSVKGKVLIPVHFWGSVKKTGLHFIPVDTNLISGISLAGGPNSGNATDDVYVTTSRAGKREKLHFDISEGGDIKLEDFKLQPGDTVFIPNDTYLADRAYYTSLIGVIATILSSILLYRQVQN